MFQSGFTANTGVLPVIAGEADLIVSDALNHASIIDGMRLSQARRGRSIPHKDVAALREHPRAAVREGRATPRPASPTGSSSSSPTASSAWTATSRRCPASWRRPRNTVPPSTWTTPTPLACWATTAGARVDHFGLHGRVAIQVGTLSKAVGVLGGYVAGSAALRDLLTQRARPFLFSTSHPPAVAAACIEALRVMQEDDALLERLWANTRRFKAELARLGFDTGVSETPITPIMVGDSEAAIRFSDRLFEAGVFATSVVYPTVALDGARLRTIVTAAHTDEHLDRALETLARVGRELGLISG